MTEHNKAEPVAWDLVYSAVVTAIDKCKDATGMRRQIELYVNGTQITHDIMGADNTPPAAPLVRLTVEEVWKAYMGSALDVNADVRDLNSFANAIMDAMIQKNGGGE